MKRITAVVIALCCLGANLQATEALPGVAATNFAFGISLQSGIGIAGDPHFTFGLGSLSYLRDGYPTSEFGYQLSAIRLSRWETTVRFGGIQYRSVHPVGEQIGLAIGARVHQLPYVSGFYIRTRWTLGVEAGFMAEVFEDIWARVSVVALFDQPLLTGYGYFGSGAVGVEVSISRFINLGG